MQPERAAAAVDCEPKNGMEKWYPIRTMGVLEAVALRLLVRRSLLFRLMGEFFLHMDYVLGCQMIAAAVFICVAGGPVADSKGFNVLWYLVSIQFILTILCNPY